jgi:hypothetical protein
VECVYCKKQYQFLRQRDCEHYGYQAKMQKIICTKMPIAIKWRFKNYSRVLPPRMIHIEIYGTMAASSGATQPIEVPLSSQSIHNTGNVGS